MGSTIWEGPLARAELKSQPNLVLLQSPHPPPATSTFFLRANHFWAFSGAVGMEKANVSGGEGWGRMSPTRPTP